MAFGAETISDVCSGKPWQVTKSELQWEAMASDQEWAWRLGLTRLTLLLEVQQPCWQLKAGLPGG